MNKTAIKNYAIWARIQLIESCKQRAYEYGITEDNNYASNLKILGSRILTDQESEQRAQLIDQIRQKGYAQVMEEAAYTWFNRFIALRFMEVNGYLPSRIRVFTDETGAFKPEIIKEAMTTDLEGIDRSRVIELLEKQDNDELYKYLLVTQCNALSNGLPYMFEKISNWTELLFPANLLRNDSIVGRMISDIPEDNWTDAIQIIGWLYQYYNSELKDETFALLKKNVKITKERIPAATQLFTPDWIVRYMVENSLGRLWYEGHKDFDKSGWKYYLDEADQDPEVEEQLAKIRKEYSKIKPEEIKVIDPCMGSGHILVYAFDVLMQIYTSAGWAERDAARSIIENNLYGLDIDDRAGQLAYFAVMMKARKYSRRIMTLGLQPNVMSIQDSSFMTNEFIDFVAGNDANLKSDLKKIKEVFTDAKEYGSILNIPYLAYDVILDRIEELQNSFVGDVFQIEYRDAAVEKLFPLIKQAVIMSQKYHVVVTNPPYMGESGMSGKLNDFVKRNYSDSKSDLFAVFIEKCGQIIKKNGYQAMITQHAWMFLPSFEKLRIKVLNESIVNMAHLGARAFEEIGGEVVQTTTFVLRNNHIKLYQSTYCRLVVPTSQKGKEDMFLSGESRYITREDSYVKIPGSPIAYWISDNLIRAFEGKTINDFGFAGIGMRTGDNKRFLRLWFEVAIDSFIKGCRSRDEQIASGKRWVPYNKGGEYRKWYGNNGYVVNWLNDGEEVKENTRKNYPYLGDDLGWKISNEAYYYQPGITWSGVTMSKNSFRVYGNGFIFDSGANGFFPFDEGKIPLFAAYLNNCIAHNVLSIINPTINTGSGTVKKIPVVLPEDDEISETINDLANECIKEARIDWDAFEISWDFKKHPLL